MASLFGLRSKSSISKDAHSVPVTDRTMTTDVKLSPPPDSRLLPPAPLREGDDEKMAALKQVVDEHRAQHPCPVDYEPYEHHWLSDPLIYSRYIRATRGDLKSAKKRIIETLTWRRDYRPEIIPPGEVSEEAYTGKHVITGFDRDTRPILYLRPGRENTKPSPRQIRYMVWSLERAIDLMQPGQESVTIIVDFHGAQFSTMPSLGTARHVAHILQTHYAERLGRAFVFNTPKFITAFFTALSPFLDPVTKDKIRFNYDRVTDFIAPDQLDAQFPGGNYAYRFDFDVYWPALIEKCGILPDGTRTKEMLEK